MKKMLFVIVLLTFVSTSLASEDPEMILNAHVFVHNMGNALFFDLYTDVYAVFTFMFNSKDPSCDQFYAESKIKVDIEKVPEEWVIQMLKATGKYAGNRRSDWKDATYKFLASKSDYGLFFNVPDHLKNDILRKINNFKSEYVRKNGVLTYCDDVEDYFEEVLEALVRNKTVFSLSVYDVICFGN
jgi:hypothetical protein